MIRPHPKTRTFCPAHFALGPWSRAGVLVAGCLPPQPPPFERHPHPAGDEGNVTAEVAPSGLGQCHVVEPESARARPGSHDTHGQGLLERAQVWSVMRGVRVTLPLHYRYITVTLPLHHGYITVTSPLHYLLGSGALSIALPSHYRHITVTLPLHYHYITVTLPLHYLLGSGALSVALPLHYRHITATLPLVYVRATRTSLRTVRTVRTGYAYQPPY